VIDRKEHQNRGVWYEGNLDAKAGNLHTATMLARHIEYLVFM
jgi:hypothetical protein